MEFIDWLEQSWVYITASIGGITLLWGFRKILKEIKDSIKTPITNIDTKMNKIQDQMNIQDEAIKSILMKDLVDLHDKCIKQGYVTTEQKRTWYDLYDSYKSEHGNGFADSLKSDMDKLETREK